MKRLKAVHIAWWLAIAVALFVLLYNFLPFSTFLGFSLNAAFAAALAAVVRYSIDGYRAAKAGLGGENFLLTALLSIFTIVLVQRGWAMSLDALERPDWMTMSFMTPFIPFMMAAALALAVVAPDIDGRREGSNSRLGLSLMVFLFGVMAGVVFYAILPDKVKEYAVLNVFPLHLNRPPCPDNEPVWVSSKGVYHTASSPYRSGVIARWCFSTVEEAEKAGFRPPKSRGQ